MAKQRVFSAQDAKLGIFMNPFLTLHLGQALRMWEDAVNGSDTIVSKHPSDFVLYEIGIFDDDNGLLVPHNPIQRVASALEALRKPHDSLPGIQR